MKRIFGIIFTIVLFATSSVYAENTVDVIIGTGTTQSFTDEAVSTEDLKTILRAGISAESAINQQPWFFVAVTNQEMIQEISGSGMGGFTPPEGGSGMRPEGISEGKPEGAFEGGRPATPPSVTGGSVKASLGDSPVAIIIYKSSNSKSPDASFDCGLATQNMVIAASSLGYGVKIVSSPIRMLNGENHDALCEKLGVDPEMQAVAVLLIGHPDSEEDAISGASTRDTLQEKTVIID